MKAPGKAADHKASAPACHCEATAANATSPRPMAWGRVTAKAAAAILGCKPKEIFLASTGVIGEKLPTEKLIAALPRIFDTAAERDWQGAAKAIMTTDTFPKGAIRKARIGDTEVTIAGIAKGSGMIAPDMATMLSFVATDAAIADNSVEPDRGKPEMK